MELWTIQMGKWRKAKAQEIEIFDITLKSGNRFFAPSPDLFTRTRAGLVSPEQYVEQFHALMRERWRDYPQGWDSLFQHDRVALACYCPNGAVCHRYLIKDYALKVALRRGIDVTYLGEITS